MVQTEKMIHLQEILRLRIFLQLLLILMMRKKMCGKEEDYENCFF